MNRETLLLIDGHSMAFRAFFALPAAGFQNKAGQHTNAVHGFTNTLLRLIHDYQPTHVAVAFDLPGGTFRTRRYADYKGGRAKTPEEFIGQVPLIQELLTAMGIKWITVEDYEADDIVATLATTGSRAGMRVYIASGDKDTFQLVNEDVSVAYPMPRSQMVLMTPQTVELKTGVPPELYSDLAALVGEGADNIPGVPGVGPKTAAKWLTQYGSLSAVLENADEIKGKVGESLRANLDQVRLNREINQLVRDLAAVPNPHELPLAGVNQEKFHQICDVLDFASLRTKVLQELPLREAPEGSADMEQTPHARSLRVLHRRSLESGQLKSFLAEDAGTWGLAVEGNAKPGLGSLERIALAQGSGDAVEIDFANVDTADDDALRKWLADDSVAKVAHATKALRHVLHAKGYELAGVSNDTELQAYLLHPDQRKYDFEELAQRYLSLDFVAGDGDTLAIAEDGSLATDAGVQLCQRALAVLDLSESLDDQLAAQKQSAQVLSLELLSSDVLARMEERGIAVDVDQLDALVIEFARNVEAAKGDAHRAIDDDSVNLSSPKQLQAVLFERLGLPKTRKTATGYTTNADALLDLLEKLAPREDAKAVQGKEFLAALLNHRDAVKLAQSVEGLRKAVQPDGKIHTTYQQTVAATGRLSSIDPNLQNIHARTQEGLRIREVFVPSSGYDMLLTADYSQIEMRLMAHLSEDEELIAAFNDGADLHRYVASKVYGVPEVEVTAAQRSKIKAMSYGLVYGLSSFGLASQLKISVREAQVLMDGYFSRFGRVKEYLDSLVARARTTGYTETILGRRRYLPELLSTNRQVRESAERMALNAPIQGSAADIIKIAMLETEAGLKAAGLRSRLLLQVHDELVLEVVQSELGQVQDIVTDKMGSAFKLSVPLTVGMGVGDNWRSAAH